MYEDTKQMTEMSALPSIMQQTMSKYRISRPTRGTFFPPKNAT